MAFTVRNGNFANAQAIFGQDIEILTAAVQGYGVLTGCVVTAQGIPDMSVHLSDGATILAEGSSGASAADYTVSASHATYPRLDLLSQPFAGSAVVTAGIPDANVSPPTMPAGHIALATIYVRAGTTAIEATDIIDKRVLIGYRIARGDDPGGGTPAFEAFGFNPLLRLKNQRGTLLVPTGNAVNDHVSVILVARNSIGAEVDSMILSETVQATAPLRTQTDFAMNELSLTETWDDAAHDFTGLSVAVTNTSAGAGSLLFKLAVGGASKATINASGALVLTAGITCVLPTAAGAAGTLWNDSGTVKVS